LEQLRDRSRWQALLPYTPSQQGGEGRRRLSDVSHGCAVASSRRPPSTGAGSFRHQPQVQCPRLSGDGWEKRRAKILSDPKTWASNWQMRIAIYQK
jgi:hypothetical protein